MTKFLKVVLLVHGAITLAGAAVLTAFPTAIPATVGIDLAPKDYLLVYLVGAAELAVAVLSFGATRLADRSTVGLVIATLVAMHAASGVLNVLYVAQAGWTSVLAANTVARLAAVAVLLLARRFDVRHAHQT